MVPFIRPLLTVIREGQSIHPSFSLFLSTTDVFCVGMETVVFIGGVSLGEPAILIPLAAITGTLCDLTIGYAIYSIASRTCSSRKASFNRL